MEVSIIIPTYNGGELLYRTLRSIYSQKTEKTFEVIAIDSGSDSSTLDILHQYPIKLIQIPQGSFNHGLSRDRAAEDTVGEFLIFINQDAEPKNRAWLDLMVAPFSWNADIVAVQGKIQERTGGPKFFWGSSGNSFYYTFESREWLKKHHNLSFSTVNCAMRRSIWEQYRFGKMAILEDKGFQKRIHITGREIAFSEGTVWHTHDYNYWQLRKRCLDEGYGWRLVGEKYRVGHCLQDLFLWQKYRVLFQGIVEGEVNKPSEVLFPLLRPLWIFLGNRCRSDLCRT